MSSESITSAQKPALAWSTILVAPWYRVALGTILVLAALLDFIQLDRIGLGNTYYAAAVKSMLTSWHNFFFASLDPGGFVSIDKPPLAFWFQAASAKLFGFSGISLLLPQALAGVFSVALLYHLVARTFGRPAGLLAALALAIMPVAVVVNRSNLVESILVLTVLLAAWAVMRAAQTGQLRWLLLGAFLLGLGFNEKMLEAYLVLPALIVLYLLGSPVRWQTRFWHLALAGVVLLVVSLSWITAVDLTPTSQRPYVGSSGDNSELSLALGYNGLGRLTGNAFAFLRGGTSVSKTLSDLSPTNLGFTTGETGGASVLRLINAELGGQTSWLLLLAILGFVAAAWQKRVRLPLDHQQQALVLWGTWLLTGGAFFSVAGFFHAYYLAMIAPPIAALAGIGIVTLWRDYRRPSWRGWLFPLALIGTALIQAHILSYYPDWSRWLTPLVVVSSILLAIILVALRLWTHGRTSGIDLRIALGAAGLATLALLLTPFIWSEYTVAHAAGNTVPSAGPRSSAGFGGGRFAFSGGGGRAFEVLVGRPFSGERAFGPRVGVGFGGGDQSTASTKLIHYLEAHQGHAKFLVATLNAATAEPFILATDKPVMDLGGFMGGDRILNVSQLTSLVKQGMVRYFLFPAGERDRLANLPQRFRAYLEEHSGFHRGFVSRFRHGFRFRGGFGGARDANSDLVQWVSSHCSAVPSSVYQSTSTAPMGGGEFGGGQQLYDCGAYAKVHARA